MSRRGLVPAGAVALAIACGISTDLPRPPHLNLVVTPESLAFHGRAGDTLLPDRYLALSFAENVTGPWHAFEDDTWFFLSTNDGELPFLLTVAPRPAGLGPGTYATAIRIVAGDQQVRVPVTLDLVSITALSGRWAGRADTLHIVLDLDQEGASVTGSGSVGPPVQNVAITGTWTEPNLSLVLHAPADTLRLVAALVNDNVLSGTLARSPAPGAPTRPLTLYRQ